MILKLKHYLTKMDPYHYSILLGLKLFCIEVVLLLVAIILQFKFVFLGMLVAGIGIVIIELGTYHNQLNKKDNVFFTFTLLTLINIYLFSYFINYKIWFLICAVCWNYLLSRIFSNKTQGLIVVSILLILGLISVFDIGGDSFTSPLSKIIDIAVFCCIAFWGQKLFPNLYQNIWRAATMRSLETMHGMISSNNYSWNQKLYNHYEAARNIMPLLMCKPYRRQVVAITDLLSFYQYYLANLLINYQHKPKMLALIDNDIQSLYLAVSENRQLSVNTLSYAYSRALSAHYQLFSKLIKNWNQLCLATNN